MNAKRKILFLCTHNAARSQMAEGFVNAMYVDRYEAYSAGNDSHEDNVGIIESMELLPYVVVTGVLLATGMAIFWFLGKRSAR